MTRKVSKKKLRILQGFLWCTTFLWLLVCMYLSWQTGEETVGLSWQIARPILESLNKQGIRPDPHRFHMGLRLFAHFGVFFVTGVLFAGSLELSFPGGKRRNIAAFLIGSAAGAFVAVAVEVGKLAVPGRHLTWSETGLNVLGAVCGAAAVCLAVRLYAMRKAKRGRSPKINDV